MNILFVTNGKSYPENENGIAKIVCNLAREMNGDVDLLTVGAPSISVNASLFQHVIYVQPSSLVKFPLFLKKTWGFLFSSQCTEDYIAKPVNKVLIKEVSKISNRYQKIIFFGSSLSYVSKLLDNKILRKTVFYAIDNKWLFFDRKRECAGLIGKFYSLVQMKKLEREFNSTYLLFPKVVFVSRIDLEKYEAQKKNKGSQKSRVIPNGVMLPKIEGPLIKSSNKEICLYLHGDFSYSPNVEAANNLLDINDCLKTMHVESTISFVGKHSDELSFRGRDFGTGYVDSVYDYLPKYGIYVCKQTLGAGIKNKLLEAFSCKMLVMANDVAMMGIDAKGGVHYIDVTGMSNESVAMRIRELTIDEIKAVSSAGFEFVAKEYSWGRSVALLREIL